MFKYNLGQVVWYMRDNKIHSAKIGGRSLCEVDAEYGNTRMGQSWVPKLVYGTVHGNLYENQLYSTVDALLQDLKANANVA